MGGYRKNTWLALAALVLGLVAFPVSYSEAQSAQRLLLEQECDQLGRLILEKMDKDQLSRSQQCDMWEADQDWKQQYGGLDEIEILSGVVYE
ncbi:hypothetical protein [Bergeriella denitrificans]|uniref:Putative secreted protein n=1 Tax=Bergeriella denitrificans TaxID=494 RepID=A0A378UG74_BERDE|nr:hypothetical protein [Bergeriella denitrificans]STZ75442.1 putative secreted protein [Bergeriella denitrificans]